MFAVFVPRFAHINSRCRVVCVLFCICPSEVGDAVVAPYGVDVVNAVLVGQTVEKSFGDYRMHGHWFVASSRIDEHCHISALLGVLLEQFAILDAPHLTLDADLVVGVDGIGFPSHGYFFFFLFCHFKIVRNRENGDNINANINLTLKFISWYANQIS